MELKKFPLSVLYGKAALLRAFDSFWSATAESAAKKILDYMLCRKYALEEREFTRAI